MAFHSKILGVGAFVPPNAVSNKDLEKMMDTSDEWITQRTGIKNRYWVSKEMSTSDLALKASEEAIKEAGLKNEDIDMIIFATLSPDHDFPGTGCFLQAKLGLSNIPAFDIRQQCTGFIYGLSMADNYVKSGQYQNILLVGAEVHSKGLDRTPRGRDVSVLFGDGAGAVVIGRVNEEDSSQIYKVNLHCDGNYAKELWIPAPGNAFDLDERLNSQMLEEGLQYPKMNGKKVFTHAVKKMSESLSDTLNSQKMKVSDIDLYLFHQANLRINDKVGEMLGIKSDQVFNTIQKYGNTTAATIPLGMRDAIKAGKLKRGMDVGLAAFGSGFTWASAVLRY